MDTEGGGGGGYPWVYIPGVYMSPYVIPGVHRGPARHGRTAAWHPEHARHPRPRLARQRPATLAACEDVQRCLPYVVARLYRTDRLMPIYLGVPTWACTLPAVQRCISVHYRPVCINRGKPYPILEYQQ